MSSPYPQKILTQSAVYALAQAAAARVHADTGTAVPVGLVMAVIERESLPRYNANSYRREPDGRESWGLMQVLTDTARMMGYTGAPAGLLTPGENVYRGTRYLAWQLRRYGGDVTKAVAAYNAGTAKQRADGSYITTPGYLAFVLGRLAYWAGTPLGGAAISGAAVALAALGLFLLKKAGR